MNDTRILVVNAKSFSGILVRPMKVLACLMGGLGLNYS